MENTSRPRSRLGADMVLLAVTVALTGLLVGIIYLADREILVVPQAVYIALLVVILLALLAIRVMRAYGLFQEELSPLDGTVSTERAYLADPSRAGAQDPPHPAVILQLANAWATFSTADGRVLADAPVDRVRAELVPGDAVLQLTVGQIAFSLSPDPWGPRVGRDLAAGSYPADLEVLSRHFQGAIGAHNRPIVRDPQPPVES